VDRFWFLTPGRLGSEPFSGWSTGDPTVVIWPRDHEVIMTEWPLQIKIWSWPPPRRRRP